ncbi:MAG: hypothetical protein H6Q72_1432 [Firmicutes bacterium]|nr:hypothetical protein [Bacillota bacterium]
MMSQSYQHVLFEVPEYQQNQSELSQVVFLANLTVFLGGVWHLMTAVTYGVKTGESLARLTPDGMWERMCQGYCQASLDGSLVEFSGTWPKWGITQDGVALALKQPGLSKGGNEFSLWPRPTASDHQDRYRNLQKLKKYMQNGHQLKWPQIVLLDTLTKGESGLPHPEFGEWLMGFPIGWTDLEQ